MIDPESIKDDIEGFGEDRKDGRYYRLVSDTVEIEDGWILDRHGEAVVRIDDYSAIKIRTVQMSFLSAGPEEKWNVHHIYLKN